MVAYMDAEALAATIATGEVHFHSRSRDRLWRKGETSGNVLRVVDLAIDCDGDALLCQRRAGGPDLPPRHAELLRSRRRAGRRRRHRVLPGSRRCGRRSPRDPPRARRARTPPRLLAGGVDAVARKVTEEATEVLLAAKRRRRGRRVGAERTGSREALAGEAADLLYHALVLLAERGLPPAAALDTLRSPPTSLMPASR